MKPIISVKDRYGNVYSMPSKSAVCILEIHYCTSYIQFIVQDEVYDEIGKAKYPTKNIVVPLENPYWVDMLAVSEDEIGELVIGGASK